jgi:hypothetical protein
LRKAGARGRTAMTPIEDKLIEVWHEFKIHAQNMGYTNQQNINECLNGAGAFLDFLCGRQPRAGTSYATANEMAYRVSFADPDDRRRPRLENPRSPRERDPNVGRGMGASA